MSYTITTSKSWAQTQRDIAETMRLWGVREWDTNYPRGARSEARDQSEADRTVTLTYSKNGTEVVLSMARQKRAVDNLRVLCLAVEAMRLNEKRGVDEVIQSAYLQLAAPMRKKSPWEVLNIMPGSPLAVAEAAYKHLAKTAHPDAGGSAAEMRELNEAIEVLRKDQNV